jgi:hypothetical protein
VDGEKTSPRFEYFFVRVEQIHPHNFHHLVQNSQEDRQIFTAFSCQHSNNAAIPIALKLTSAAEFVIRKITSLTGKNTHLYLKVKLIQKAFH